MPNYVYGTNSSETIDIWDGVTSSADVIYGYGGNDNIWGMGGADTIYGGSGADNIDAGSGNDLLIGGTGADDLDGSTGTDTASYDDSTAAVQVYLTTGLGYGGTAEGDTLTSIENVTGSWYDDFIVGDDDDNVIAGLGGADTLKGGGGADTLYGDSGNDTLKGGGGADTLNGGSGTDTANYAESSAGVIVSLITDTASDGDAEGDELNSIENLTGSAYADHLWGSDGVNVLRGMDGDDSLKGFGGNDTLRGDDGNDTLNGGAGVDTMIGGLGSDIFIVDNVSDVVVEASFEGNDVVRTSTSWTLQPGVWVETLETTDADGTDAINLTGNGALNTINGNDGDNVINGGSNADTMTGFGGDDIYIVDNESDVVVEAGGGGNDVVYATSDYVLSANIETLSLNTGSASSAIGNAQDNEIYGNAGDNYLNGGYGADDLNGLGGNDYFVFQAGQANGDTVYEFNGNGAGVGDVLYFSGYGTAAEGATFVQQTATDWLITSADGLTTETITLSGAPAVHASDFLFA